MSDVRRRSLVGALALAVVVAAMVAGAGRAEALGWAGAASMSAARQYHTATLLKDGRVLVAGGDDNQSVLASAETYNPATNSWSAAGSMSSARYGAAATLLGSGKVLVAGGSGPGAVPLSSADLFDPATGAWAAAPSMHFARSNPTATLLASGRVLVTGGGGNAAEIYDPLTNAWSVAASMSVGRVLNTATLLGSGKVLVAGGTVAGHASASAEVYDPNTDTWSGVAAMGTARTAHTAVLLPGGKVLVAGGETAQGCTPTCPRLSSAELYDAMSNTWTPTGAMAAARERFTDTLLANGTALVAGGFGFGVALSGSEIYDPASGVWSSAGSMSACRSGASATLLSGGNVLVTGGESCDFMVLSSAEVYVATSLLKSFTLTRTRFRVGPAPTPISARARRAPAGTQFRYELGHDAVVRIAIVQRTVGKRSGTTCRASRRPPKGRARCLLLVARGTLIRRGHAGANGTAFSGRIGRRALPPGGYEASTTASAPGFPQPSGPRTVRFAIVSR